MGTVDDHTRPNRWHWEQDPDGIPRFMPAGDLDCDVHADLAAALGTDPPGPTSVVDIDLRAVTFLDAGTACLLARYQATAHQLGKRVRIVNAAGMPRKVLTFFGVLPADGVCGAADPHLSRPRRQPVTDLTTTSSDVFARARRAIARTGELCSEVERLREAHRRPERE